MLTIACAQPREVGNDRWGINRSKEPALVPELGEPWIVLEAPLADAALTSLTPLVELRGRVGVGPHGPQDVVLAIDTSGSVFTPSGADLDADGTTGALGCDYFGQGVGRRCLSYRRWTTDFDDIVLKVEISAAVQLVGLLNPDSTRMGMVKFGDTAWVEQPLGALDGVSQALEGFRYVMRGGTDIPAALQRSLDLFEEAPVRSEREPQRTILLLSDGVIALPYRMRDRELEEYVGEAVERARRLHVRIFAFGVGETSGPGPTLLWNLATYTRGRHVPVPAARDIAVELPMVSLTGVSDVDLVNETDGRSARATRIFPDGTFDGLVPLREGENSLRVTATLEDGRTLETRRSVHYAKPTTVTPRDISAGEALLTTLRERTIATDAAARVHAERRRRRLKVLELEVDDPNAPVE